MFILTYKKTGKSIKISNTSLWLSLDQSQLEELGWKTGDLWDNEVI